MKAMLLILAIGISFTCMADRGYKETILSEKREGIILKKGSIQFECTETDFWGQSYFSLQSRNFANFSIYKNETVDTLLDGDCRPVLTELLQKFDDHHGELKAVVHSRVYEYTQWGIISDGTPYAEPYCDKTLIEQVDVFGLSEQVYAFQSVTKKPLAKLSYDECVGKN